MNAISKDATEPQELTESATAVNFRKRGVSGIDTLVGSRLRLLRQRARAARRDMAAALGISVQQLSKYEMGTNRMSVGFLYEAALYLRIPVQSLLVDVQDSAAPPALVHTDEEAVLRFVFRNIRSPSARDDLIRFIADLLAAGPDSNAQGAPEFEGRLPVAAD